MYLGIIKRIQAIPNIYTSYRPNIWSSWGWPSICLWFCKEGLPYLAGPVQVSMGVHLSSVPVEPPLSILDTISFVVGCYPHEKYPRYPDEKYPHEKYQSPYVMKNIPVIRMKNTNILSSQWKIPTYYHPNGKYPTFYPNGNVIGPSTPMKNSSASPGLDTAELQLQRVSVSADLTRGLRPRRRRCRVEMKGRLLHWCWTLGMGQWDNCS